MAFLEVNRFCSLDEYQRGLENRISEQSLQPQELYTMMLQLGSPDKEAAKMNVRMLKVGESTGAVAVRFAFLNNDLENHLVRSGSVFNGFVNTEGYTVIHDAGENRDHEIRQIYFRDFFEDQFGGLLEMGQSNLIGASSF